MTNTLVALRMSLMYFAAAGPCVASLPRTRWKVFQPFSDSAGLVAEAVMVVRPALSKIGSAALDSPEKAGPTMPTTVLSSIGLLGQCRGLGLGLALGVERA